MSKLEFFAYALISVFISSSLTFSLAKKYDNNKKVKYVPVLVGLILACGMGVRAILSDGAQSATFMFYAFFGVLVAMSSLTTALSIEKSKEEK
ncbi:MAG: hypothetical protein APF76_03555 [Desulfitibacter sp. BRH_c19]|nr:MAG: hypothetical protein APF76_03555 [Desulfitibacter sp. BRH_c19]